MMLIPLVFPDLPPRIRVESTPCCLQSYIEFTFPLPRAGLSSLEPPLLSSPTLLARLLPPPPRLWLLEPRSCSSFSDAFPTKRLRGSMARSPPVKLHMPILQDT